MGSFDEVNRMEKMMGLRGASKKGQANKLYRRQHKQLSDEDVAGIGSKLGDASGDSVDEVKRGRRRGKVGSIFDQVVAASGIGG